MCRFLAPFFFVVGLLFPGGLAGESLDLPFLQLSPNGIFTVDGARFALGHFDNAWAVTSQESTRVNAGYPQVSAGNFETRGEFQVRGSDEPLHLVETVTRQGADMIGLKWQLDHTKGLVSRTLCVQTVLPVAGFAGKSLRVDGKDCVLPVELKDSGVFFQAQVRELVIPTAHGTVTITGSFSLFVQDNRTWGGDNYSVRIHVSPPGQVIKHAELQLSLRYQPYRSQSVSIAAVANRAFRDEDAGDGEGGWTDQGEKNDLASMPLGKITAAGVSFEILDPERNRDKSCIVLGASAKGCPQSVEIPLPAGVTASNLYLLHAAAATPPSGAPVGVVTVGYAGGQESRTEIVAGRDIGDWQHPVTVPNGAVGWIGKNPTSGVGLYVSRVALKEGAGPVEKIRLEATGPCLWMVAAISASPDRIAFSMSTPEMIAAGGDWISYEDRLDVDAGSAFDFSSLTEAPAGKYGQVCVDDMGHFYFRDQPKERVRFWGVNLCFSANFLKSGEADRLAERLARSGYNAVRLHHFDGELIRQGGASYELDEDKLDRFEYLIAALKKRGLYVNIDLYTIRKFSPAEQAAFGWGMYPDKKNLATWFKAWLPVSDAAFDSWKRYATNLLTHKNPYTKLSLAEDPVLIGICPVNEDPLPTLIFGEPGLKKRYDHAFEIWVKAQAQDSIAGTDRSALYNRFLFEMQAQADAKEKNFLRQLGVWAPITGNNYWYSQAQIFLRERYDYVDNHSYWDHPQFPEKNWSLPFAFRQGDPVRALAYDPRELMATRVFGKPFAVTEYNFVWPNAYRAAGGALMSAYSSLQDWDAIFCFDYSGDRELTVKGGPSHLFDLAGDPINRLADRVAALIFRRGDIRASQNAIAFAVDRQGAFAGETGNWRAFPETFGLAGLVCRIGSLPGKAAEVKSAARAERLGVRAVVSDPADLDKNASGFKAEPGLLKRLAATGVLPKGSTDADEKQIVSDTGEIRIDAKAGSFSAVGERCELFAIAPNGESRGKLVAVKNGSTNAALYAVSVDNAPLATSRRWLLLYLTDGLNTGTQFSNRDHRLLTSVGTLPHLLRRGQATVSLSNPAMNGWKLWALDSGGKRLYVIPMRETKEGVAFDVRSDAPEGACLAYELAASNKE